MEVDPQVPVLRRRHDLLQKGQRHRVGRVGGELHRDELLPPLPGVGKLQAFVQLHLLRSHDAPADGALHAHLQRRLHYRIHEEIHVAEGRYAVRRHLEQGKFCAPGDVLSLQLRLGGPNLLLQPLHERGLLADPPQQAHGRMGVGVHEARKKGGLPSAVHRFGGWGSPVWGADGSDPAVLHHHRTIPGLLHSAVAEQKVFQQQGHVIPPSSSCTLPARGSSCPAGCSARRASPP